MLKFVNEKSLEDRRIRLQVLSLEDSAGLRDLYDYPLPIQRAKELCQNLLKSDDLVLAIIFKMENRIVGIIEVNGEDEVEIGYRIKPQDRGYHFGRDAVYMVTGYLLDKGIKKVYADVRHDNEASIKVLSHNGFELVSETNDICHYERVKSDNKSDDIQIPPGMAAIVLAGGCFWGVEKAFQQLNGVISTTTGYVNGNSDSVDYAKVCRGDTGYKEAVYVIYDERILTLEKLMKAYFICINPTQKDRQGNDIGSQYQTGVYYLNDQDASKLAIIFNEERQKYDAFYVELEHLQNFVRAEDYHQDYLTKHPQGYCHIALEEFKRIKELNES